MNTTLRYQKLRARNSARFFEKDNGNRSAMKLMCFISLLTAISISCLTLLVADSESKDEGILLTFGFVVSAFAPKAVQKFAETKVLVPNSTEIMSPGAIYDRQASLTAINSDRSQYDTVTFENYNHHSSEANFEDKFN